MNKVKLVIWQIAPRKFDDLIDQLLHNRGIIESENDDMKKLDFFKPDFDKDLHDPYLMKNLKKAVLRIQKAAINKETICIFADYDADGIPGAALLYKAFSKIGLDPVVYIPSRDEGYGLSPKGLKYLKDKKCGIVVTVDLGIRNFVEAEYAAKIGLELIITDHHLPDEKLPAVSLVINPKQKGDKYPYKDLSGCGVAFKLISGLAKLFPKELGEKFLKWNLDLVAISTISDVVPLSGENRVLAKYGLIVLQKTKNLGLESLIKSALIKPENINVYAVGFQIGPRINAPGRIDHATKSFELLVTEDEAEAKELASWLNGKNESRQLAMDRAEKEAAVYIEENNLAENKMIVALGDWQKGIIGPTASRLVERFGRPVILFVEDKDQFVGSARSVSGINIVEILTKIKTVLSKYGGHAGAAGLAVSKENWLRFLKEIKKIADKNIFSQDLVKKVKIDSEIDFTELTKNLYEKLLRFEPFGMGNPRPVFAMENVTFQYPRFVGKESNHFSASIGDGPNRLKVIHFNFPYEKSMINKESTYDLAFTVSLDEWEGRENISLNVVDIKSSDRHSGLDPES